MLRSVGRAFGGQSELFLISRVRSARRAFSHECQLSSEITCTRTFLKGVPVLRYPGYFRFTVANTREPLLIVPTRHPVGPGVTRAVTGPPGPEQVISCLSERIIKRRRTGGVVTITLRGRCVHLETSVLHGGSKVACRGDGMVLVKPSKAKGALVTGALSSLLRIPFTVYSTAALARTKCIKRSIRSILRQLLSTTKKGLTGTRDKVIFLSRVSGLTGRTTPRNAESMKKRKIRRTLLGVLRKAAVPMTTPHDGSLNTGKGRTVGFSASGLLFILSNTFSKLRGVIRRQLCRHHLNFAPTRPHRPAP